MSPTKNGSHQSGTRIVFGHLDISVIILMILVEYNFGKLCGVIKLPTQNGPQTLGNISELSRIIVLPTTMGHNCWALESGLGIW